METRNVAPVSFPSPGETWLSSRPTIASDSPSTPTGHTIPSSSTLGALDATSSFPNENGLRDTGIHGGKIPQDVITLPPEALLENSENGLVKMVFFSYDGLHHLLQPDTRTYTVNEANFKVRVYVQIITQDKNMCAFIM